MKTVIYQSFRTINVPPWMETCLGSVRSWTTLQGFDYRFYDDEIFERVPGWVLDKAGTHRQIATDLGRLILAQELLANGYERVVWVDADVLVFDPGRFSISIDTGFSFGREVWVQPTAKGHIRAYKNVHNALSVFCQGNSFLAFYIGSCLNMLERAEGPLVPQIIGPKFLTALHNIIGFNLIDAVGMASPLVINDLAEGGGGAWDLLRSTTPGPICALNLCSSLAGAEVDAVPLTDSLIGTAAQALLNANVTA